MAKYTDEQIKAALECCSNCDCKNCPCFVKKTYCEEVGYDEILDLINRQEAEYADLQEQFRYLDIECERLEKANASQEAEIERLKKDNEHILMQHKFQRRPDGKCWNDVIEKAKSEAIKEFAEMLNEIITEIYNKHIFGNNDLVDEEKDAIINFSDDITYKVDNLVKEMVGEEK